MEDSTPQEYNPWPQEEPVEKRIERLADSVAERLQNVIEQSIRDGADQLVGDVIRVLEVQCFPDRHLVFAEDIARAVAGFRTAIRKRLSELERFRVEVKRDLDQLLREKGKEVNR